MAHINASLSEEDIIFDPMAKIFGSISSVIMIFCGLNGLMCSIGSLLYLKMYSKLNAYIKAVLGLYGVIQFLCQILHLSGQLKIGIEDYPNEERCF